MNFEPGIIVIGVAMLLFYLRLAQIRGHKRKELRQEQISKMRSGRKSKGHPDGYNRPNYEIGSYYLLALGAALMLIGLVLRTSTLLPELYRPYWWEVVTVGVVAFIFSVK